VMDLTALVNATRESYISSYVMVLASITICTGLVFFFTNVARSVDDTHQWIEDLSRGSSWSLGLISPISAVLAAIQISRQLGLVFSCDRSIARRMEKLKGRGDNVGFDHLTHIRALSVASQALTIIRIIAALAAAVSLPWAWIETEVCRDGPNNNNTITNRSPCLLHNEDLLVDEEFKDLTLPFWVAVGSICLWFVSLFARLVVEYSMRWRLDTRLGEYVCLAFEDDIKAMKSNLTTPHVSTKSAISQERTAWEYVARMFLHQLRLDAILGADRVGSILQFIQSGLVKQQDLGQAVSTKTSEYFAKARRKTFGIARIGKKSS